MGWAIITAFVSVIWFEFYKLIRRKQSPFKITEG